MPRVTAVVEKQQFRHKKQQVREWQGPGSCSVTFTGSREMLQRETDRESPWEPLCPDQWARLS